MGCEGSSHWMNYPLIFASSVSDAYITCDLRFFHTNISAANSNHKQELTVGTVHTRTTHNKYERAAYLY